MPTAATTCSEYLITIGSNYYGSGKVLIIVVRILNMNLIKIPVHIQWFSRTAFGEYTIINDEYHLYDKSLDTIKQNTVLNMIYQI